MCFVPPDLLRMLTFVLGVENWHSGFFAILTLCSRCVETTSWVLWFPLFICASSFLLSRLEPYLSTNAGLWPPSGLLSFFLILFSYGNDCDRESAVALCWFVYCRQRFARRQEDQQTEPTCSSKRGSDLTLCGRGTLHLMSHEATKATLPFGLWQRMGKVSSLSLAPKLNGCRRCNATIPWPCRYGIPLTSVSVHQLEQIIPTIEHRNLFPVALWMTWIFLGVVDHHCSLQFFPTGPSCSR